MQCTIYKQKNESMFIYMKISNTAATHITDFFINSGTISQDDKDSYIYCFEYLFDMTFFPLSLILFGIIFKRFIPSLIFCLIVLPLKMAGGGAHASSRLKCSIISYSLYFITLFCYPLLDSIPLIFLNICYILCCALIICLAPVDHKNNRLDSDKKHRLKKLCILYIILISVVYTLIVYNDISEYHLMINACILIIAANQVIGKLKH